MLARLLRAGELDFIWVPDEVHEAVRDLVRARQAASFDVRKARQRIQSFLLKHSRRYVKKPWGAQHRVWLANQSFEHPAQQIAFENYIRAEGQSVTRRAEIDQQLRDILPSWSLAPMVEALQALRGVAFVIAVCLVSEIGDFARFKTARHLMAFLGLVPGERSSGSTVRPRGITKTGNKIVRSHLIEAAWCYRLRAKVGVRLVRRDNSLPEVAKEIAWKAQVRLCARHRRLVARGKKSQLVTTAIARELVGFIWAIGREFRGWTQVPA
jgi:transposase